MKKLLVAALLAVSPVAANAALLLGSATLDSAGDLTQVQDGSQTYQFLDLTSTQGMSQAVALATYGSSGFTVATSTEMTALYNAFGFTYVSTNGFAPLGDLSAAESIDFIGYFGSTFTDASLGSYIDLTYGQSYNCIGFDVCATNGFNNRDDISYGDALLGVYLVRAAPDEVPEPAILGLFGLGAIALGLGRRRKRG